jgi:hypothetical protein
VSRRTYGAVKKAERSGAGQERPDRRGDRWPGAMAKFAFFGEVLYVGVLVSALSIPLVTLPLAFAIGTRHLRRFLRAESSGLAAIGNDLKRGLLPSLPAGAAVLAAVLVLLVDLAVAHDRLIPGAILWTIVGWLGLAVLALAALTAASFWSPERGWFAAFRSCGSSWQRDPVGVCYLLAAIGFVPLLGWQLMPLVVPAIGCLVLALVAIPERGHATVDADR